MIKKSGPNSKKVVRNSKKHENLEKTQKTPRHSRKGADSKCQKMTDFSKKVTIWDKKVENPCPKGLKNGTHRPSYFKSLRQLWLLKMTIFKGPKAKKVDSELKKSKILSKHKEIGPF